MESVRVQLSGKRIKAYGRIVAAATDSHPAFSASYDLVLDVDVVFSPFFNALPIRRTGLHQQVTSVTLPVVYVRLPDFAVETASISYSSDGPDVPGVKLRSPLSDTTVTVDSDGFILDYPGLAERI